MSAIAKPARLWLKPATNRGAAIWHIKCADGNRISTGCGEADLAGAERKLAEHIAASRQPERRRDGDPRQIPLADILNVYARAKAKSVARPKDLMLRMTALLNHFGRMTLGDLAKKSSEITRDEYVAARGSSSAARRELEDLGAAMTLYFEQDADRETVVKLPKVALPPKPKARQRFLSRGEAARLIWSAWRYREVQKGVKTDRASRQHVARFILMGLYTGTRSGAICNAALTPAIGRGYVDLDKGIFYRHGLGDAETNKRQPAMQIPGRLLAHMRRWRRLKISNQAVIEYEGQPVGSVRKAFARAAEAAGFNDVIPHTLRHTAVSWAVQNGVDLYRIADFFGMTVPMILETYGHLRPDNVVGDAITGRNRARR
jgi:integrase